MWAESQGQGHGDDDVVTVAGRIREVDAPIQLSGASIAALRPRSLDEVILALPSVSVASNSRGEVVASIRGRGERETTVTLEGIPLNDPWDGRVNFSVLPVGLIGSASVQADGDPRFGSASVLAFDLDTKPPSATLTVERGSDQQQSARLTASRSDVAFDISHAERDGFSIPADANAPLARGADGLRLNSDRSLTSLSTAMRASGQGWQGGGFATWSQSSYGVPPETHLELASQQLRYWRIPKDDRLIVAGYGSAKIPSGLISGRLWFHENRRQIDIYSDAAYQAVTGEDRSDGRETGGVLSIDQNLGRFAFGLGTEIKHSTHTETIPESAKYSRASGAAWAHLSRVEGKLRPSASVRFENLARSPRSSGEIAPDIGLLTGRLELSYHTRSSWQLSAKLARLGRAPSQRELFGTQLGRFVVNDDLQPEVRSVSSVTAWKREGPLTFSLTAFAERSDREIGQQLIEVEGNILRQRTNQSGFETVGLVANGVFQATGVLRFEAHAMALNFTGITDQEFPTERPQSTGELRAIFAPERGLGGLASVRRRGEAYSLGLGGKREDVPAAVLSSIEINNRALLNGKAIQMYLRAENGFDELDLPQLGLPAAGRSYRAGIRLAM